MQWLLTRIKASHTAPCDYQAKLFGGGAMFEVQGDPKQDIGARNISIARQLLAAADIPLLAEHVGGNAHRKLIFDLGSGHVWLARKPHPPAHP
jgi:chemotaxis protein CheD